MSPILAVVSALAAVSGYARPELLAETGWLQEHLSDPDLRIVDTRTKGYELNGGFTKWTAETRETSDERIIPDRGKLDVEDRLLWIATAEDVAAAIGNKGVDILDAATPGEIAGTDLRGNPRGGAVPWSIAMERAETLDPDAKTFPSAEELQRLLVAHGLDPKREVITYCQGGGRAAHEIFVLHLMGYDDLRLYLGSWEDWSRRPDLPVALPETKTKK